jgi:adenylate kinase
VIFDGYPRNTAQAETLDRLLEGKPGCTVCLSLKIDEALLVDRITGRINCKNCKKTYNIKSKPPKMAGFCDDCGGPLVQREDDKPETLRARLETYRKETLPILDYYSARKCLIALDGDGEPEAVFSRLKTAMESALAA